MFSIRSVLSVGFMTLISRALGFVREMLIAHWFGTSAVADAWFVAQRLPNLFRRLFAEGAFNSAFVPMFAAVAGTALLCDAWFDLTTSGSGFYWALAEALAAELPLAALCFWVAFEASEAIGLTAAVGAASAAAPRPTSRPDQPAAGRAHARRAGSEAPTAGRTSR